MSRPRYEPMSTRRDACAVPVALWREISERYTDLTWRGVFLEKGPFQLAALPLLIQREGIASVLELGSQTGGSALWLADQLALLGRPGPVVSVDLDLSQLHPDAAAAPGVRFVAGDLTQAEAALPPALLASLPHPWLVLEDAHVNLPGVLEHLWRRGLQRGDYLVVEDTNLDFSEAWSDWPDAAYMARMSAKMAALRAWITPHEPDLLIDTFYQDLFGYNISKSWNSILRRM